MDGDGSLPWVLPGPRTPGRRVRNPASLVLTLILPILGFGGLAAPASSQVPDSVRVPPPQEADTLPADTVLGDTLLVQEVVREGVTPRGAFIRSALIPGWGHLKAGSPVRGGFYFALQSVTGFMLFKTQTRIRSARNRRQLREDVVTARLAREGNTDPLEVQKALDEDPEMEDLRALEEIRGDQREDWMALGIFLLFLGGADAYVSAHLADFPTAVVIEPTPSGGVEVGFSLPIGF